MHLHFFAFFFHKNKLILTKLSKITPQKRISQFNNKELSVKKQKLYCVACDQELDHLHAELKLKKKFMEGSQPVMDLFKNARVFDPQQIAQLSKNLQEYNFLDSIELELKDEWKPGDSGNLTENEDETRLDDDIIPLENDLDLEN
ncbi:hypothetical protein BpHYR1_023560 [Brachionus plicatilis]|uniref:Uncharacterized protein n=1 Tax=Brachionus plicatilis TaxID=10195 RepID=A0A3M7PZU7_BRAPC|nr:hypothetical protein BpHYR1_023560 [Brachionus plicatilis]